MALVGFLPLIWEIQIEILDPGFGLAQSGALWAFGERSSRREFCLANNTTLFKEQPKPLGQVKTIITFENGLSGRLREG